MSDTQKTDKLEFRLPFYNSPIFELTQDHFHQVQQANMNGYGYMIHVDTNRHRDNIEAYNRVYP